MTDGQNYGFGSSRTLTLLAIATLGFISFLRVEAKIKQPMLDLHLFRNLQFSLSLLTAVLVFIIVSGVIFITPFFLKLVLHYPIQSTRWQAHSLATGRTWLSPSNTCSQNCWPCRAAQKTCQAAGSLRCALRSRCTWPDRRGRSPLPAPARAGPIPRMCRQRTAAIRPAP